MILRGAVFGFLTLFLCVEFAEARLLRFGGRGTSTSTSPEQIWLVENDKLIPNPDSPGSFTIPALAGDTFAGAPSYNWTSGSVHLIPVPAGPCLSIFFQDEYEQIPPEFQL